MGFDLSTLSTALIHILERPSNTKTGVDFTKNSNTEVEINSEFMTIY